MIELPEAYTLEKQLNQTFLGKTIVSAVANASPHAFAWYTDDPALYNAKLAGKKIMSTAAYGGQVGMLAGDYYISFFDGIRFRLVGKDAKRPVKHQLLIEFDDGSALCCTVMMYGGVSANPKDQDDNYFFKVAKEKASPYSVEFDENYFDSLRKGVKQTLSAKAFLATEQRIPGFGNGVLHDTLFNARIHPKRKLNTLGDNEMSALFNSIKTTLTDMRDNGGRDTEKDLYGNHGGYRTVLSSKTLAYPCFTCGSGLKREAYMGGNIYYCPGCQPLVV